MEIIAARDEAPAEIAHRLAGDISATSTFLALATDALAADDPAHADVMQAVQATQRAMDRVRVLMASLKVARCGDEESRFTLDEGER